MNRDQLKKLERDLSADVATQLLSDGRHIVPFDEVVRTMWETGRDMQASYRETARGGLAKIHLQRKHGLDSFPGMGS